MWKYFTEKHNYYKDERASDCLQPACKNCMNSYTKSYHTKNKEKTKKILYRLSSS